MDSSRPDSRGRAMAESLASGFEPCSDSQPARVQPTDKGTLPHRVATALSEVSSLDGHTAEDPATPLDSGPAKLQASG